MNEIRLSLLRNALAPLPDETFTCLIEKILYGNLAKVPLMSESHLSDDPEAATRIEIAHFLMYLRRGEFDKIRMV